MPSGRGHDRTQLQSPMSDEEFARRLQFEEEQQQQHHHHESSRNLNTERYTQQELDDLALARQYAQMYSDDAVVHTHPPRVSAQQQQQPERQRQHHHQMRSPPQSQKSYNSNYHQRSHPTRSESGIYNAISLGAHTYSTDIHGAVNGYDHYRTGIERSPSASRSNRNPTRTSSFRDPFDYANTTDDSAYEYYSSPPSRRDFVSTQEVECHPSFLAQYDEKVKSMIPNATGIATVAVEDKDLELARRMQDLEDRGLGQQNSDRMLENIANNDDLDLMDKTKPSASSSPIDLNSNQNFESIAKLLSDSGADMNAIPDDLLRELLGSDHHNKIDSSDGDRNPPRSVTAAASVRSNSNHTTYRNSSTSKPGKSSSSSSSSPSKSAVIFKDFDHSKLNDLSLATDGSHASKNNGNKAKRRGIFGFALADKNKFNLDQITMDAPTTTLLPITPAPPSSSQPPSTLIAMEQNMDRKMNQQQQVPPTSVGGGIPAAIPPAPTGNMSFRQRHARSVSPHPNHPDSSNKSSPPNVMPLRSPTVVPTPTGTIIIPPSIPSGIPSAIPPKPVGMMTINQSFNGLYRGTNICAACGLSHGTFLKVLDRKYHPECFRCTSCNGRIDPLDKFKYTTDDKGRVHPHHRECFNTFGVQCCVCQQKVPVTPDGRVPFIKHPFFSSEVMCVKHADEDIRRCCGCQRLEPFNTPYIDLMDEDRCVCPECCQSVVVDSSEATPLWMSVLNYMDQNLKVPIWGPLRDIPILMVGVLSLQEQMLAQGSIHGTMSQNILTAGLCVTEPRDPSHHHSYMSQSRTNNIVAILCPTGLPRALVAGILAHESIHAWIQLHPNYNTGRPLSAQVVEGLCQLVASLYLSDGVMPNNDCGTNQNTIDGTSEKKLRQYYKFCIERDQSDIYGNGYRRAAVAYRDIGMEGLLSYILEYRDFPPITDDDGEGILLG